MRARTSTSRRQGSAETLANDALASWLAHALAERGAGQARDAAKQVCRGYGADIAANSRG